MSRSVVVRIFLIGFLITALFTGCSRDPNVRKQKYLESGDRFFDKGKYAEASIEYQNAIRIDSRFAQAHYKLAETYIRLGDGNGAVNELNRAVDLAPDNYHAQLDLANLLTGVQNPDGTANDSALKQARVHLDFLREKQPQDPAVFQAWADYYEAQNNLGAALQEMKKGIAADPKRSESYVDLARLQERASAHDTSLLEQVEANYKKAAQLDPKAVNPPMGLGGFYEQHNRMAEAEQQFKHAIELAPKNLTPRQALVSLYLLEGRRGDAEAFLKQTKADLPDDPAAYHLLGDFYFGMGDLDKAIAEYESLYRDHPKDLLVKRNYVQLLISKGRLDEATKLDDELLKSNPRDVDALVDRGQIQLAKKDSSGAVDTLQRAVKDDPNNAVAYYQLGLAFEQQQNDGRAEVEWREAVRLRPNLTEAQTHLAALAIRRGDNDALMQTAEQIIAGAPRVPDGYLLRALAESHSNRLSESEKDLRKAMEVAPASAVPYVELGNLRREQKQYPEAINFYRQALDKDSSSIGGLRGLMDIYVLQKQLDQAIATAKAQIAKSPNTSGFYDLLGEALFRTKDLSGAEAAFRKAIALDKNNSDAILKLGEVQVAEGSVNQALATYQRGLKDNPRDVAVYDLAGEMYDSQGNWDQAKAMYQKALEIQPDEPLASNNLAYGMLQHGGNIDVALAMAQTARRGSPDSSTFADTLGWAYFQKGVYQSAINLFQEALRLDEKQGAPDNPDVHVHLGLAYQKANQPAQARQQLERALKIDPNNNDARKALSELRG